MTNNPILDELHAVREQLLADAGGSLDALVARLQAEEQKSDRPRFVRQKTVHCTSAAKSDDRAAENRSSPAGGDGVGARGVGGAVVDMAAFGRALAARVGRRMHC